MTNCIIHPYQVLDAQGKCPICDNLLLTPEKCPMCAGTGNEMYIGMRAINPPDNPCPTCNGTGLAKVKAPDRD